MYHYKARENKMTFPPPHPLSKNLDNFMQSSEKIPYLMIYLDSGSSWNLINDVPWIQTAD